MNHDESALLAQTAHGRGYACACGCVSLAFGMATLHFEGEAAFDAMAGTVLDGEWARRGDEGLEVRHSWIALSLSPLGAVEPARPIGSAMDAAR